MYKFKDIRHVHLEISTLCNASCPWCPRNFWGYPYNAGYPETNLTLAQAQHIFQPDFVQQLTAVTVNGNYGDIVMNPDGPAIIQYLTTINPQLKIDINTNGSARPADFWRGLVHPNVEILFALDGLEDTHHLYRQNTRWSTVIKNAQTYIQSGGHAVWKMIEFDHNRHQITQCQTLSKELGFKRFQLVQGERTNAPVFNQLGECTHILGNYSGTTEFPILFHKKTTDEILLEDILPGRKPQPITCTVKQNRSVYIAANGDVSPCCYTGFYPQTYGHGQYHQAANAQLTPIMQKNNALEHSLEECIEYFTEIEKTWSIPLFEQGRLVICNDVCGQKE